MTYIGIDFSLNSTSVCIEQNGVDLYYSIIRPKNITKKVISAMDELNIQYTYTTPFDRGLNYSKTEIDKLEKSIEISGIIIDILDKYQSITLGCEGLSYNNIGSRALDIAGYHYILRYYLNSMVNIDNILYIPPTEIKKYAIKGNADKKKLFDAYLNLQKTNILTDLIDKLLLDKDIKNIPKPIDDMIDAFYIKEYIKKYIF